MNKGGQFFLVAAIIIVGIMMSLTAIVNSAEVGKDNEAFYDLAKEVKFETDRVLDMGVFNPNEVDIVNDLPVFLENYANYIAQEQVVFIYGDLNDINALYFQEVSSGSIGIDTGPVSTNQVLEILFVNQILEDAKVEKEDFDSDGIDEVKVSVNNNEYIFNLKEGQFFYLVMIKNEDDERFVAKEE